MSAVALNDRQWVALWALDACQAHGLTDGELKAVIGKYATNTIQSLVDVGLIALTEPCGFGTRRYLFELTDAGTQRIERMKRVIATYALAG